MFVRLSVCQLIYYSVCSCVCLSVSQSSRQAVSAHQSERKTVKLCVPSSTCQSICLSASLPVCLSHRLDVCLSASLPVCLSSSPPASLSACLSISWDINPTESQMFSHCKYHVRYLSTLLYKWIQKLGSYNIQRQHHFGSKTSGSTFLVEKQIHPL